MEDDVGDSKTVENEAGCRPETKRQRHLRERVHQLKSRLGDLSHQTAETERDLTRTLVEASGVAVGDIVVYRGKRHRVTSVDPQSWNKPGDKPWLSGNPEKADGTFGTAIRNLYSEWTLQVSTAPSETTDSEVQTSGGQLEVGE